MIALYRLDVLCVQEHWIKTNCEDFVIGGMRVVSHFSRERGAGGGVFVMLRTDISSTPVEYINELALEAHFEISAIRLNLYNMVVVCLYRPPGGDLQVFHGRMDLLLSRLQTGSNTKILIGGDFNVHFNANNVVAQRVVDSFRVHGFNGLVEFCTRRNNTIDNVFTNTDILSVETFPVAFRSDHTGVAVRLPVSVAEDGRREPSFVRPITGAGMVLFSRGLAAVDWRSMMESSVDVNENFDCFLKIVMNNYCSSFPEKMVRGRGGSLHLRWFNEALHAMRETLQIIRLAALESNDVELTSIYKQYQLSYRTALRNAKMQATNRYIENSSNKCGAAWRIVNTYRVQRASAVSGPMSPNSINLTLIDSIRELTESVSGSPAAAVGMMPDRVYPGFRFTAVTASEIRKVIQKLNSTKCRDIYGLSAYLIKYCGDSLIEPLEILINSSLPSGVFPEMLKAAVVVPIAKKNDKEFRPISILPIFSKIFEKIIFEQILDYFENNKILAGVQYGFRVGMGTLDAVVRLLREVLIALEQGEFAILSSYDLSKAFDCLDRSILLSKLRYYGFDDLSYKLVSSYFEGRTQIVRLGRECSDPLTQSYGAAQGSILGPLFFIILMNDLPQFLSGNLAVFYADDSSSVCRSRFLDDAMGEAAEIYKKIETWFRCNGFSLNKRKSTQLLITLRNHNRVMDVSSVNILGVHIDSELTWSTHGDYLAARVGRNVFLLRRLSFSVDTNILRMVYFAVCHSLMAYCLLIWGHSAAANRIFALQRRAVRVVAGAGYRDDCRPIFVSLRIMTLPCLYIYQCLKFVKKNRALFMNRASLHDYGTRNANHLHIDRVRLNKNRCALNYWGPKLFNALDEDVRNKSVSGFNRYIRLLLTEHAFYSLDEYFEHFISASRS